MRKHKHEPVIAENGLTFFQGLTCCDEGTTAMLPCLPIILELMGSHAASGSVTRPGVYLLHNMSLLSAVVPAMRSHRASAVPIIQRAIFNHGSLDDGAVKKCGKLLLASLENK